MKKTLTLITLISIQITAEQKLFYKSSAHYTHQPALYELTKETTGPVIEFGCGHGSTDLLHSLCKKNKRLLISLDDNQEWLNKFAKKYENDNEWHKFYFVPGKKDTKDPQHWVNFLNNFEDIRNIYFDICFVDQAPWLARYETIKYMKDTSRYILLHDCNYFPEQNIFGKTITAIAREKHIPGIYDFSDIFLNFKVYYPTHPWPANTGPPTLVGSNFCEIPDVDFTKYD